MDRSRPEFWFWFLFLGSERKVQLVVAGACEGPQDASVGTGSFRFHYPVCWEQDLSVHLQVACLAPGTLDPHRLSSLSLSCAPPPPAPLPCSCLPGHVPLFPSLLFFCPCHRELVGGVLAKKGVMTGRVLSLPVPKDDPQEQLKVPLPTLPSSQLVRLVFPTSQVLGIERSWVHAWGCCWPWSAIRLLQVMPKAISGCKGGLCERAWGPRVHGCSGVRQGHSGVEVPSLSHYSIHGFQEPLMRLELKKEEG